MTKLSFDPKHTALLGIDLHAGLNIPYQPYSYAEVSANSIKLVQEFAKAGAFVALSQIPASDGKDRVHPRTDMPAMPAAKSIAAPELLPELTAVPGVHVFPKLAWSAFYGTDLDMQLRRRGIDTIILFGVATEYGVDTSARAAYDRGYNQIFAEDAMTAWSNEAQEQETKAIMPKMGQVRSTAAILQALTDMNADQD